MPYRPPKPCAAPGCPAITHRRFCAPHQQAADQARGTAAQRGYGARWRQLRLLILARDPICRDPSGCIAPSTDVDHVIPRAQGGDDREENLRGLCHRHHSRRTAIDSSGWGGAG
ncbi:MAG: HNH endonuclease [Candidatus Rokubacteria bacterium]|nr:HNH endonuclease [Candidatus Rokubacteria bacterium]